MKKMNLILSTIFCSILLLGKLTFKTTSAVTPVDTLSKTGKYFNNLKLINDTRRNIMYYAPKSFKESVNVNHCASFLLSNEKTDERISVLYSNNTLFSAINLKDMPYEASFVPGDTLDKWVTKLFSAMSSFYGEGLHYDFIEKQSNMYIVKYSYGEFDDNPVYTFYKISNGVPLSMSIGTSNYSNVIEDIVEEAKILFNNFNSIKSYASNPNIGFYYVCIGSFKIKSNADNLARKAKSKGFDINVVLQNSFYRVYIGAFRIRTNAESLQKSAISKGFKDTFLYYRIKK